MTDEDDRITIPLSALQHWAYCPRQCALIHLEQAFDDNLHTLRGNALHARVDQPGLQTERGRRVERALPLWHEGLGLIGKADAVEFDGKTPYPVEYKQGSRHKAPEIAACDELQLAAQALCLQAMTGHPVPEGAIFYASSKRRQAVLITAELRQQVETATVAVRDLLGSQRLPAPLQGAAAQQRCKGCSLHDRCQPEAAESPAMRKARASLFDPDAEL